MALLPSNKKKVFKISSQSVLDIYNDAALLLNISDNFSIENVNSMAEKLFGFTDKKFQNIKFSQLILDCNEGSDILDLIMQLDENECGEVFCRFQTLSGISFSSTINLIRFGFSEKKHIHVVFKDIEDDNFKELTTLRKKSGLGDIVDTLPVGIFIFTEEMLVYNNVRGEDIYKHNLNANKKDLYSIFPREHKYVLTEMVNENNTDSSSYTEISLGAEDKKKTFNINMINILYEGKESILMMLIDITLRNEYSVQKIRAEIAEETNKNLIEEIRLHRRTQIDLIEKTSKLNALFESSNSLFILTIDRDLRIASFNSSFKRMMKAFLHVDVVIGDDFLNTFPIEEVAYRKLIKKFKLALRGESVEIISHFPVKGGEIWMESFISPVRVEGEAIKEIAFVAHNITEKVENERKILDSEASNKATVSAIPDMLFKVNKQGYFTAFKFNDEGTDLFKEFAYTTDLLGREVKEVFKNKKIGKSFLVNVRKALRTGEIHTQNFTIPFIIGKTDKKLYYENRYSKINANEVVVIARDVTDKVEFETRLIESVREKEILLKEVHHRVKNNLQVISSILNLQSSYVDDEKTLEIINESQNRIRSMSYIHESLYQTKDFSSINFKGYITNLVQNLIHSYQLFSGKTKLNLEIEEVQLVLDQAIPCGLILNELVSNSLKYAYPEGQKGEILIAIKEEKGNVIIHVEDFGQGLPEGFKIEDSDSLGLGLVDTLVDQIDGELILKTGNGTKYLIIFEKQEI